jgi:ABC-type polysaccharide/polyol phosphate export permease
VSERAFTPLRARHLALVREVAISQTKIRDQHTALGFLWSFLHPLLLLGLLYLVFHGRLGTSIPNYALFTLLGIIHYTHFSKSTAGGMRALVRMRGMAVNAIFPKEILVLSSVLSDVPEFAISLAVGSGIALLTGSPATGALLALPLVVLLQLTLVVWIALMLAIVHVFVRDIDHIYEVALRILFFATPIFYDLDFLGPLGRRLMMLNPLAHVIGFTRAIVLEGRLPDVSHMLAFLLISAALAWTAITLFRRVEPVLLEHL